MAHGGLLVPLEEIPYIVRLSHAHAHAHAHAGDGY